MLRQILNRFFMFGLVFFVLGISSAHAADLFTVKSVKVDKTAESAAVARDLALTQGRNIAFDILAKRLLSLEELESLGVIDDQYLVALIKDFEIQNEQLSTIRYVAELTFRFDEKAVKSYFEQNGIGFSSLTRPPVLILPFLQDENRMMLWDDNNHWRMAWEKVKESRGLVRTIIPWGDIQDLQDVPDQQALSAEVNASAGIARILERYGADEVIVPIATLDPQGAKIYVYTLFDGKLEHKITLTVNASGVTNPDPIFAQGVKAVQDYLQQDWKKQATSNIDQRIRIKASYKTLSEWVIMKEKLEKIDVVVRVETVTLGRYNAELDLFFKDNKKRLIQKIGRQGLDLQAERLRVDGLSTSALQLQSYQLRLK